MCQYKSICNPIIELTTLLQSCGFTIEKQELKDWHFNEFEIVMKGKKLQLPMIDIEGHYCPVKAGKSVFEIVET